MLPWTSPVSFSGFVKAGDILGYCPTNEGDEIGRSSVDLNGGLSDPSQLGKVFVVPKGGDWYATDKVRADYLLASPDGTLIFLGRRIDRNGWVVELRSADLSSLLWSTKIRWDEQNFGQSAGVPSMVWSTDGKLICWRIAAISPFEEKAILYCIDTRDGALIARVDSTREVLGKCLILISPRADGLIVKHYMGLDTLQLNGITTRPGR
jgi:hypothetical protein